MPVLDHGLLYGDGVFEGIRFYDGHAFRLGAHLERLYRSAAALRLTLPCDRNTLTAAVAETIKAYGRPDGYLRLVVTRGPGRLGLDPSSCSQPNIFIIADELSLVSGRVRHEGARVIIAATRRIAPDALDPRIKSLNYLNHILARIEATNAGADEAILLNSQGHVAEGTADNVFVVRDGMLFTPPASNGALEGIPRAAALEIAHTLGIVAAKIRSVHTISIRPTNVSHRPDELIPVRDRWAPARPRPDLYQASPWSFARSSSAKLERQRPRPLANCRQRLQQ